MGCIEVFAPVCGTDGTTYSNFCYLSKAACSSADSDLSKAYDGECKKDCPDMCSQEVVPVCATDGTTHSNICELEKASCKSGNEDLIKAYDGECRDCPDMCSQEFVPVCGTDGTTYSNACELGKAACSSTNNDLAKAYDGECEKGSKEDATEAPIWTKDCMLYQNCDCTDDGRCPIGLTCDSTNKCMSSESPPTPPAPSVDLDIGSAYSKSTSLGLLVMLPFIFRW